MYFYRKLKFWWTGIKFDVWRRRIRSGRREIIDYVRLRWSGFYSWREKSTVKNHEKNELNEWIK
jgi:hypothetical protein